MKIKSNFSLRNIAGSWVALPVGNAVMDFTGMLTINETGLVLWHKLEGGCTLEELADALTEEYEVSYDQALADASAFVEKLSAIGCIEK